MDEMRQSFSPHLTFLPQAQTDSIFLIILFTFVVGMNICQSIPIALGREIGISYEGATESDGNNSSDYTCYDIFGVPHKGLIPHPNSCNYYLDCILDSSNNPIPNMQICDDDGTDAFDMEDCICKVKSDSVVCFDPGNPEHEKQRFKCAEELLEGKTEVSLEKGEH